MMASAGMRLVLTSAGAALVAALVAGCGGGTQHLSKADYLKRGNAICAKGNAEIQAAAHQRFTHKPTGQQVTQFAKDVVLPNIEKQVSDLEALPKPSGDESTLNQLFTTLQEDLVKVKAEPALLVTRTNQVFADANRQARAYGLDVCAS